MPARSLLDVDDLSPAELVSVLDRAVAIITSGVEPLRELIGAMHSKLLLAALRRARGFEA